MQETFGRKKKILNDPVYGFININDELIFDIIEHPWFQRLRRIKQLGLTHLVYPGALHTRFHHSIGAMHLMQKALEILSSKGHMFSKDERLATLIAILLHDIGHGPYSHSLEKKIVEELSHEELTLLFLERLKRQFGEIFDLAIKIFSGDCSKSFLHQLVSSQLDTDRLDFLKRDSYFTGVAEGVINSDRIITMMEVVSNNLVIEAKGIYSIENFIVGLCAAVYGYKFPDSGVVANLYDCIFTSKFQILRYCRDYCSRKYPAVFSNTGAIHNSYIATNPCAFINFNILFNVHERFYYHVFGNFCLWMNIS
jgi:HD superfamily phosphohydrolase